MNPKRPNLLRRLFIRNREGGHPLALEPEPGSTAHDGNGHSSPAATADPPPAESPSLPAAVEPIAVESSERLSRKEEMAIRIQEGFHDLSGLLCNVAQKMELQGVRNSELVEQVRPLPTLLNRVSEQLEAQRETSLVLRDSLKGLEAVSQNQIDFLKKLDQNQRETVITFQRAQTRALNVFYKAQKDTYDAFRKQQETQARQFQDIIVRTQKSFTRGLVIFFVATLVAVSAAVVIARGASTPSAPSTIGSGLVPEREPVPSGH